MCFSRDSGKEKLPKKCSSLEPSLFKREGNPGNFSTVHKISTDCSGTSSDRQCSARNWVPWSPQPSTVLHTDHGGINFHFLLISPPGLWIISSQLGGPDPSPRIRTVTIQVSSSEHSPSCSKTVTSEEQVHYQNKPQSPSATGSSKAYFSSEQVHPQPQLLVCNQVGNSPIKIKCLADQIKLPEQDYPYKTLLRELYEHCLGTQCLNFCHQVHRDYIPAPPSKPSPPGRALLPALLTRQFTGAQRLHSCSTFQAFSSWMRAPPALLTRQLQVSQTTFLLHLQAFSSWTRAALLTRQLQVHRDYIPAPPSKPSPPGRALLQLYSLGNYRCTETTFLLHLPSLLLLDARSSSSTHSAITGAQRLHSCSTFQAFSSWTRAPSSSTHSAIHRCTETTFLLHLPSLLLLDVRSFQLYSLGNYRCTETTFLLHLPSLLLLDARSFQLYSLGNYRCRS